MKCSARLWCRLGHQFDQFAGHGRIAVAQIAFEFLIDVLRKSVIGTNVVGIPRLEPTADGKIPERVAGPDRAVHPVFMHEGLRGQFFRWIDGLDGVVYYADGVGTRCEHTCAAEEDGGQHPLSRFSHCHII